MASEAQPQLRVRGQQRRDDDKIETKPRSEGDKIRGGKTMQMCLEESLFPQIRHANFSRRSMLLMDEAGNYSTTEMLARYSEAEPELKREDDHRRVGETKPRSECDQMRVDESRPRRPVTGLDTTCHNVADTLEKKHIYQLNSLESVRSIDNFSIRLKHEVSSLLSSQILKAHFFSECCMPSTDEVSQPKQVPRRR